MSEEKPSVSSECFAILPVPSPSTAPNRNVDGSSSNETSSDSASRLFYRFAVLDFLDFDLRGTYWHIEEAEEQVRWRGYRRGGWKRIVASERAREGEGR